MSTESLGAESVAPFATDECRCPLCCAPSVNAYPRLVAIDTDSAGPPAYVDAPRRIVAFTGLAGSGKSTAAAHLVAQGWTRVRFAGPLKAMMAALGLTAEQIEGSEKEKPCALLGGKTPRYAMQTIGTEWGRDIIAPDLWIRAWQTALPSTGYVVVDDCRFPNEAEAVRAAGGVIVRIVRPGAGQGAAGHSSEGQDIETGPEIDNAGSIEHFIAAVDELVESNP